MAYFLFLLVNAALFLRPAELISSLEDVPIYEVLIVSCLLISLRGVASQLNPRSLQSRPISACVVGLMGALVISAVLNPESTGAFPYSFAFSKLLCYYFLLVAVVDTPAKLRGFVYYLGGIIFLLSGLALLQYHGVINVPALAPYAERQWEFVDEETGQGGEVLVRLCAAGIYNNPNDFARILAIAIVISLYGLSDRSSLVLRIASAVLLGVSGYAFALTHSRGGFLGLLASLLVLFWGRFGARKTIWLGLMVVPLLVMLFGGRQTSIQMSDGTGHQRIDFWYEEFEQWRENPLFGVGMIDIDEVRPNAHNSFVQAFTALGLFGGTLFFGAFYLSVLLPFRLSTSGTALPQSELRRMGPYLVGIIAGYAIGMLSSSRNGVPPTYMLVGLATVYVRFAGKHLPATLTSLTAPLIRHVVLASLLFVAALYLFIRISLAPA
jgi:putative inorganic carbon (HCO3(-)) transporter